MKTSYLLAPLLVSFKATANPIGGSDSGVLEQRTAGPAPPLTPPATHPPPSPTRASDPPPAPTPLPGNLNGVLLEGTIINYNVSDKNPYSCWNFPLNLSTPGESYAPGTCPVCVLQRNNNDGSADYQLWARDNLNNPIGNMQDGTKVFPLDGKHDGESFAQDTPVVLMGGSPLQLHTTLSSEDPNSFHVFLVWATPPRDPKDPTTWLDPATPLVTFDSGAKVPGGDGCEPYGTASDGAVIYFECYFDC